MFYFETLFWIGILFIAFHLSLFICLFVRMKSLYPGVWQSLGSPTFFPTSHWSDSVFGMKMVGLIYASWPEKVNDGLSLGVRNILRVTTILGVAYFLIIMAVGVFVGGISS